MTVHLIEGSGTIHRYFHIYNTMARIGDDHPTGAIYGAAQSYWNLVKAEPDYLAVCYDGKSSREMRQKISADYKSHRPPMHPNLRCQWDGVRACADAFGIPKVEADGVEADDIVATLTRIAVEAGHEVMIISNDKDFAQLLSDEVQQFDPQKKRMISVEDIKAKWGVWPRQMVDFQALVGDKDDFVKGLPGIGPVYAAGLLNEFETLDNILANTRDIKNDRIRRIVEDNRSIPPLARKLVTLDQHLPLGLEVSDLAYKGFETETVTSFMEKWGFVTLAAQIDKTMKMRNYELEPSY